MGVAFSRFPAEVLELTGANLPPSAGFPPVPVTSRIQNHPLYREDVAAVSSLALPWGKLAGKTVLVAGARGLIGTFLCDVLLARGDVSVVALGRDGKKARAAFAAHEGNPRLVIFPHDVNRSIDAAAAGKADFVVHLASTTHPKAYATRPVETIFTNVIGTGNLLSYAADVGAERFLFASSVEIYGENRGDTALFREDSCGAIDCNTLRAGYPESKRCGEALCQAYRAEKGLDCVVARLARSYGPTLLGEDTKALSQFLAKALAGEDIVLKSAGEQFYSFTHAADAVSGLLTVLLRGADGEAYNLADPAGDIRLKDLAGLVAREAGRKVVFDLPDAVEAAGFSRATQARMDAAKLRALGWRARYGIEEGIRRTLAVLRAAHAALPPTAGE